MASNLYPCVSSTMDTLSIELSATQRFFFYFRSASRVMAIDPHWVGQELRLDEQGRQWVRFIDRLVIDDFGTLVEVPQ